MRWKRLAMLALPACLALVLALASAPAAGHNEGWCKGRLNCSADGKVCRPCGCQEQPHCVSDGPCDPGYAVLNWGPYDPNLCYYNVSSGRKNWPYGEYDWCGFEGQDVCWLGVSGPPCDEHYQQAGSVCHYSGHSHEPTTNSTVVVGPQTPGEPVWGWADVHEHQFANLAYGGMTFWGEVFDWDGIDKALAWCGYTPDLQACNPTLFWHEGCVPVWWDSWWGGYPVHGYWLGNLFPFGTNNNISSGHIFGHKSAGTGKFNGWPSHNTGGHQQMYYRWLKRAYEGGLRLLVDLAVNNLVLCELSYTRPGFQGCEDMNRSHTATVDRQLQAMRELEYFVDMEDDGAYNGTGWFRIATSSSEARQIIEDGALAVILGIEVDTLFGCGPTEQTKCTRQEIEGEIEHYYNQGVRYFYPVHHFDNQFAGGALYKSMYAYANFLATRWATGSTTGGSIQTEDCSQWSQDPPVPGGYRFKTEPWVVFNCPLPPDPRFPDWDCLGDNALWWLYTPIVLLWGQPTFPLDQVAHCNARGLTPDGEFLLEELMERDLFIDVDHLSHKGFETAMNLLKAHGYPAISGHTTAMPDGVVSHELVHTASRLQEIRNGGGLVTVGVPHEGCTKNTSLYSNSHIPTIKFVEGFRDKHGDALWGYSDLVNLMKTGEEGQAFYDTGPFYSDEDDPDQAHPAIALVADMGCFLPQMGPRFTSEWDCPKPGEPGECRYKAAPIGDAWPFCLEFGTCPPCLGKDEGRPLEYPFDAFDGSGGKFYRQHTGDRTFDFNYDGLAHVGLLPDLLADVRNIMPQVDLDPLFNSAETFLRMWERIERCTPDQEAPEPDLFVLPTVVGECSATVDTKPGAADFCDRKAVLGDTSDPLEYHDQGTHTIHWTYVDTAGNSSVQTQTVIVRDTVAPTIDELSVAPDRLWPPNRAMRPVGLTATASDNCDPEPYCRITEVTSNEQVGPQAVAERADGPRGAAAGRRDQRDRWPDWVITGDLTVDLRAERLPSGDGRVYTIEVTCSDYAGNATSDFVQVEVPRRWPGNKK